MTLVIEWEDGTDEATLMSVAEPRPVRGAGRTIATVVGALAAIAFATWGIRHLRAS